MSDLKDIVIAAHGDLDRWRSLSRLTARVVNGGALWDIKGQDGVLTHYTASIELHRQFASHSPFGGEGLRSSFTPDRVAVETVGGGVVAERLDPLDAFEGHTLQTPWDRLHTAYFTGYAMWNYLTQPFLFTLPGFRFEELSPWHEDGETWRRLRVTFPDGLATHTRTQTYYVDADGLIRRHDYHPDVFGEDGRDSAHYSWGHRTFDGFVFPTRRSVHLTDEQGGKLPEPVVVAIELDDITLY
ncbi:hypothetical protein FDA94_01070 [Herbidospora galbida]|uniref:Uncharacterized protein n=1 Tax=Herbidospora galbida TaxID=2575442 RepID=A0A4U3MP84_9ACTN|nr:hypothetical protein [Herbidospora galbida]TKK91415.1 hypothetical protein FDA94_01070 [Herbidospora galbida]